MHKFISMNNCVNNNKFKKADLQRIADKMGLPTSGTKNKYVKEF